MLVAGELRRTASLRSVEPLVSKYRMFSASWSSLINRYNVERGVGEHAGHPLHHLQPDTNVSDVMLLWEQTSHWSQAVSGVGVSESTLATPYTTYSLTTM